MSPSDTLDTTVPCAHCPVPVHVSVPAEMREGDDVDYVLVIDADALRLAISAHARQHD